MAYSLGNCPDCGVQIKVQDVTGKWNSVKKNCTGGELTFNSGQKLRINLCKDCVVNPDLEKIYNVLIESGSEACTDQTRNYLKKLGVPNSLVEIGA